MVALTVSDWTSFAVAFGILLLAIATFSATAIARHSTKEAYRSRIGASARDFLLWISESKKALRSPRP